MKTNKMRQMKILAVLAAATGVAGAWAPVFGSSVLYSIGVLNPTNAYSEVRAVSGDGTYVAGVSTSQGLYSGGSPQAGAPNTTNAPVVWSVTDGLVELPDPNGTHCIAIGVAKGVGANDGKILLSGLHEKATVVRLYWGTIASGVGSGTWTDAGAYAGFPSADLRGGFVNCSRNSTPDPNSGWPPLGAWWTGATRAGGRAASVRADPAVAWDGLTFNVQSISGYARVVGRNSGVNPSVAEWNSNSDTGYVPNSSLTRADGFGISTMFGTNLTDFEGQWICGQVANYWTNGSGTPMMQAFRWNRADADMTFLGSVAPAGGGDTNNNSSVAYTIANNGVTGGRSYFGASGGGTVVAHEEATVWDTSGTWDSTGAPKSLEVLLAAEGVDTSAWTHLTRVYATSDDGTVLAGYGIWAADGSTRGFVVVKTVAPPLVGAHIDSIVPAGGGSYTINYSSGGGSQFVLLSSPAVTAALSGWTRVATNSTGSGSFTAGTTSSPEFWSIKSE
jgi:hypothetical protein